MNARETIVGFLLALIVFMSVFLIFLHFKPFYYYNFQTLNVYDGKNDAKINESLDSLLDFFEFKTNTIKNYNESEISHMKDIRKIISYLKLLTILSILLLFVFWKKDKKILFKTGLFLILIISLFAVLSLADFNIVFTKFHEIFFPQGNYMSDPKVSFMKYMFPDEFFVNFLKTMFCSLLIIAIGFEIAYFYLKNRAEKLIN